MGEKYFLDLMLHWSAKMQELPNFLSSFTEKLKIMNICGVMFWHPLGHEEYSVTYGLILPAKYNALQ